MSNILEKQLYASILAVLNDKNSYYKSIVGKKGEYNYFTEQGKEALFNYIDNFASLMLKQQDLEINERAKKLVIDELEK